MKLVIKRITLSTIHEYDFLKRYIIASLSLSLSALNAMQSDITPHVTIFGDCKRINRWGYG